MKIMQFGFDSAIGPRWKAYADAGLLPVAQQLLSEGAYADNCIPPLPTLTPTNWTTLATGAWPGTHGITDFNMHKPGQELTDCPQAFDSTDCEAESIWNAAARVGKRTILVNYPVTLPPVLDKGVQIGGAGCEITDWRIGIPAEDRSVIIAAEQFFTTEDEPLANFVTWAPGATEIRLPLSFEDAMLPVASQLELLIGLPPGKGQECALECPPGVAIEELSPGAWSKTIFRDFVVDETPTTGAFRVKLIELDVERRLLRLFVTDICALDGLEHPVGALGDVSEIDGLPLASVGFNSFTLGWLDLTTYIEVLTMTTRWLEQASIRLLSRHEWDLFYIHFHSIDWFYHVASAKLDPIRNPHVREREAYEAAELELYRSMDTAMGRILDAADEPPLTVVVSDHGATAFASELPTADVLVDAGLLVFKSEADRGEDYGGGWLTSKDIDWDKTLAIPQRSCWIYVNLKGRDPHGVVEPEEYVEVQERILRALQSYRDPDSGLCPYSLVLRKPDARILGLYGDRIGDVVYAVREEFGDEHGRQLGTAEMREGFGSMKSVLVVSGPGVKKGTVLTRTVWLTDVVPTICHIARLPVPREAEGSVIYQMLENPDALLDDYTRVSKQLDQVTEAIRRRQALTHEYRRR